MLPPSTLLPIWGTAPFTAKGQGSDWTSSQHSTDPTQEQGPLFWVPVVPKPQGGLVLAVQRAPGPSKSPDGIVKVLTIKHIKHFLYHLPEEVHV